MSNLQDLSTEAQQHIRAFRRFYLWAGPLHEAGHILIAKNCANIDLTVAKRFHIAGGIKRPSIEVSHAEMEWISGMPWASAGININTSRIYLFAKPADPIKKFVVTIPVEDFEILEPFKAVLFLEIFLKGETFSGIEALVKLPLAVIDGGAKGIKKRLKK